MFYSGGGGAVVRSWGRVLACLSVLAGSAGLASCVLRPPSGQCGAELPSETYPASHLAALWRAPPTTMEPQAASSPGSMRAPTRSPMFLGSHLVARNAASGYSE